MKELKGDCMKNKGVFITCLSASCFGLASIFGKMSYEGGNTAISMTFYRALVTTGLIGFMLMVKKKSFVIKKQDVLPVILLGIFGQTLTTILINMSYYYIPAGTALTLHFLYPAIVAVTCAVLFREKISVLKAGVILLAFLGTLFFFEGVTDGSIGGILLALLSSATWAFYIVYMEKTGLTNLDPFLLAFYQCAIMAVCCFLWGNAAGEMRYVISGLGWCHTLVSAMLFYTALVCLQSGVRLLGPITVSILGVFEPLSSLLFGGLLLHELISKQQIAGTVVILAAIVVLLVEDKKRKNV